jgi:hypothetical protein
MHRLGRSLMACCWYASQVDRTSCNLFDYLGVERKFRNIAFAWPHSSWLAQTVQELNEPILKGMLQHLTHLQSLHVVACPKIEHVTLLQCLIHTPALESLSFTAWVHNHIVPASIAYILAVGQQNGSRWHPAAYISASSINWREQLRSRGSSYRSFPPNLRIHARQNKSLVLPAIVFYAQVVGERHSINIFRERNSRCTC